MLTKHEMMRKIIHLSSVFVIPFDLFVGHELTLHFLFFIITAYSISEFLRVNKFRVPLISDVTDYCSHSFEKRTFVYSPLVFAISILFLLTFFQKTHAYTGIVALGLGDGVAGLIGKQYGKTKIFYNKKKSLEGSLSMFFVVFFTSLLLVRDVFVSLIVSLIATLVESLSNEVIDNFTIPFSVIVTIRLMEKLL
jgi:dolichol kinase